MTARRIVIIGGGFAGVTLAQELEKRTQDVEITLVSSANHLVFSPLLAEAVGRSVSLLHVVVPGRQMVKRTRWLTARVTTIDWAAREVTYRSGDAGTGTLPYDHLAIACGAAVNLEALPGLASHAYPFKTLGDAIFLSNDIIGRLEEAAVEADAGRRRRLLTVVVIGGGFSGVELCGQIAELVRRSRRFYPRLASEVVRVILLQRGDRLLPELNASSLAEFARVKLEARGIQVRLESSVDEISATGVRLGSGELIEAATIVSTVGTTTNPLLTGLDLPLERGRVRTEPDMQVVDRPDIWALGDCAAVPNASDGHTSPPTAQFATRQAMQLAANMARRLNDEPTRPFAYRPVGILASLGHRNAVAEIAGVKLSGFPAWFLWRGIYLAKVPTLSRKIELAVDWFWSMFFPPNVVQLQMARTESVGRSHYAAGEVVARQGAPSDYLSVIEAGTATCQVSNAPEPFVTLGPGDVFGEAAFLGGPRQPQHAFTVCAATALDVVTMRPERFARLSGSAPIFLKELRRTSSERQAYQGLLALLETLPRLQHVTVAELMSSPAETLTRHQTLEQVVDRFDSGRPGYPVVGEDGILCGYCGREDLYDAFREMLPLDTPLERFMRPHARSVAGERPLSEAVLAMMGQRMEILPVVASAEHPLVIGVLSPIDLFRAVTAASKSAS